MVLQTLATILLATLLTIEARPSCHISNNKDVVCTPQDKEYKLRRGLVSDRNLTTSITLKNCRIIDIGLESFNGLPSLTHLDLSINKLSKLKLGVLDGARQVTHLNLSFNMLSDFPLGLFDQKPNLEVLDLKENRINNLKLGVFDALSKLKHLDLSYNELVGMDMNVYLFDKCKHIQFLDLSGDNMDRTSDNLLHSLVAVELLSLDRCSMTAVPKFATASNLSTLKHLTLSFNLITALNDPMTFIHQDKIEILNLSHNSLDSIHENIFKSLRNLKMIMLNNNRLKEIPETLFQNMNKLININLSHNLIEFVPVNAFRGSGVKNLNLGDNRFSFLTDNFLLELRNSGTRIVKFYFNQNPWQCACLVQVINEVKSMKVEYNKAKYNGKDTVCVANEDFACKKQPSDNLEFVELYYNNNSAQTLHF